MNINICDICKKAPADNRFKVKKEMETTSFDGIFVFPTKEWVNIDICKNCYRKLFTSVSKEEKNG